jgi:hypothetical protein
METGSICLPGDKIASNLFSRSFREPISKWVEKNKQDMLQIYCPITLQILDVSKSMYADHLFNKIITHGLDDRQVTMMIDRINNMLNDVLMPTSIKQNTTKQEIVIACFGKDARTVEKHCEPPNVEANRS